MLWIGVGIQLAMCNFSHSYLLTKIFIMQYSPFNRYCLIFSKISIFSNTEVSTHKKYRITVFSNTAEPYVTITIVLNINKISLSYSRLITALKVTHIDFINFVCYTSKVKSCRTSLADHKWFTLRDKHIATLHMSNLYEPGI